MLQKVTLRLYIALYIGFKRYLSKSTLHLKTYRQTGLRKVPLSQARNLNRFMAMLPNFDYHGKYSLLTMSLRIKKYLSISQHRFGCLGTL